MKKTKKTKVIDERQEKELLKSESRGFWLAYWLLLAVMLVQMTISSIDVNFFIPNFAGEWLVFMVLCIYMCVRCMKNNIWERNREPSFKWNAIYSLAAGLVMAVISFIIVFVKSYKPVGSIAAAFIMGAFVFGLCLATLSISAAFYKKKKKLLEDAEEAETEE